MNKVKFVETNNRELPLLFSGPMVLAAMEGTKTVTRRIVNPQPPDYIHYFEYFHSDNVNYCSCFIGYVVPTEQVSYPPIKAKYARGDRIWARETWGIISYDNNSGYEIGVQYKADNKQSGIIDLDNEELWERYATQEEAWSRKMYNKFIINKVEKIYSPHAIYIDCENQKFENPVLWRPSIYLPRIAARLFLKVTDVKIERLHELDDTEARKEGFKDREMFIKYWNKLNARRFYSWDINPWVYRIEFEKAA
jgi:hypothetical protein